MPDLSKQEQNTYARLASRWSGVLWGAKSAGLQKILIENFTEEEALALGDIPLRTVPVDLVSLDEISENSKLPVTKLEQILDGVAARGLIFPGKTKDGKKGYALPKQGYGVDQVFFWKGKTDEHAQKMVAIQSDQELFHHPKMDMYTQTDTKVFRYIPITEAIDSTWQNMYPTESILEVVRKATKYAVAHCSCRVKYEIKYGKKCGHSSEVCIKLSELAECMINAGLGREISREEALAIIKKAEEEGLVHFTDNTGEDIKHICNCCGCACWNIGPIRQRKIPRDLLMATYFLRETKEDNCIGCGNCSQICPVNAILIEDGVARTEQDWCIGCGLCLPKCPTQAISLTHV